MDHVFIIAEAGVNHNGDINIALKMIDVAYEAGADAIKFQTFRANKLVSSYAPKAGYQITATDQAESQLQMLQKLELSPEDYRILLNYSQEKGIQFISSPFDIDSIDILDNLGLEIIKIPSGEITDMPYLKKVGKLAKRVILSSGMSTMDEIAEAIEILLRSGTSRDDITVLHTTTEYPAPFEEVNLRAMETIRKAFNISTGYSDHTTGIEVPVAAVALGARIIEKHFTLDRNMEGPDHKASLDPEEFKGMVRAIRNIEKSLGNGLKVPSESEKKNIKIVRKSIHYSRNMIAGTVIGESDIEMKRPGEGISPMEMNKVLKKKIIRNVEADTMVRWEDLE